MNDYGWFGIGHDISKQSEVLTGKNPTRAIEF
jgi:hypothetical protein